MISVIAANVRELLQIRAVRPGGENIERVINRPDIASGKVRSRRTLFRTEMRRRIKDAFVAGEKVRAGGAAVAGRNQLHLRTVDVHGVNLIALVAIARRLKDQLLAVAGKVSFGVLAAEGKLTHVAQMFFLGERQRIGLARYRARSSRK